MDALAETFLANHIDSPTSVAKSYFEFWERHIDTLLLLKKAHLLYFIEEPLPELIHGIAEKIGHFPLELTKDDLNLLREQSKYECAFKLAGFWSVTLLWCEEEHRKTPEEMSQLLTSNSVFMLSMLS